LRAELQEIALPVTEALPVINTLPAFMDGFHPGAPRCVRATRRGRNGRDPGTPGIVRRRIPGR
jgi:hypothetical protein